jgi:hypothetical protein
MNPVEAPRQHLRTPGGLAEFFKDQEKAREIRRDILEVAGAREAGL